MTPDAEAVATAKQSLRAGLLAGRRARPEADRVAARVAVAVRLWARLRTCTVVCAYLPLPSEPLEPALLNQLNATGVRVLVPTVAQDAPLDWVRYPTPVDLGPFGIAAPAGPRLGAGAVASADVVLVPALAVDRTGHRLGRGGGHYDRSLALLADPSAAAARRAELIAVLYDGEVVPYLPFDDHDIAVDAVVTPAMGIHRPAGHS